MRAAQSMAAAPGNAVLIRDGVAEWVNAAAPDSDSRHPSKRRIMQLLGVDAAVDGHDVAAPMMVRTEFPSARQEVPARAGSRALVFWCAEAEDDSASDPRDAVVWKGARPQLIRGPLLVTAGWPRLKVLDSLTESDGLSLMLNWDRGALLTEEPPELLAVPTREGLLRLGLLMAQTLMYKSGWVCPVSAPDDIGDERANRHRVRTSPWEVYEFRSGAHALVAAETAGGNRPTLASALVPPGDYRMLSTLRQQMDAHNASLSRKEGA